MLSNSLCVTIQFTRRITRAIFPCAIVTVRLLALRESSGWTFERVAEDLGLLRSNDRGSAAERQESVKTLLRRVGAGAQSHLNSMGGFQWADPVSRIDFSFVKEAHFGCEQDRNKEGR